MAPQEIFWMSCLYICFDLANRERGEQPFKFPLVPWQDQCERQWSLSLPKSSLKEMQCHNGWCKTAWKGPKGWTNWKCPFLILSFVKWWSMWRVCMWTINNSLAIFSESFSTAPADTDLQDRTWVVYPGTEVELPSLRSMQIWCFTLNELLLRLADLVHFSWSTVARDSCIESSALPFTEVSSNSFWQL